MMNVHEASGVQVAEIFALLLIAGMTVRGWRTGLVRSLIGIIAFVLSLYAGARFAPVVAERLAGETPSAVMYGIAFLLVTFGTLVLLRIVGALVRRILLLTPLGLVDGIGGALLGAAEGVILVAVIGLVLAFLPISKSWQEAYLHSRVVNTSMRLTGSLAERAKPYLSDRAGEFMDRAKHYLREFSIPPVPQHIPSYDDERPARP